MQVLSEYYVNLERKSGLAGEAAWDAVAKYLAWRPRAIDEEVFTRAREIEVGEPAAEYAAKPLVARLHRPRGRPKRAVG